MSFTGKIIANAWKIIIFLIAFAIVLYVSLRMRFWSGDFTTYFLRTENWGMLLLITLIVYIVSTILTKLLQWQFRLETKSGQRPAKFRRGGK
jgi:Kef-type K+ transport system membrane component KefB